MWIFRWIHLKIDGASQFSRRRRTFALCQDSTQQAQTRMSRSANVGAFKRRKRPVRTLSGPIASAPALRNHPESSSAPADRGGKLSKAIRSEGLCRDGQPNRVHRRASVREMVLTAPPPAPQEHGGSSQRTPHKIYRSAFLTFDMIRMLQRKRLARDDNWQSARQHASRCCTRLARNSAGAAPQPPPPPPALERAYLRSLRLLLRNSGCSYEGSQRSRR